MTHLIGDNPPSQMKRKGQLPTEVFIQTWMMQPNGALTTLLKQESSHNETLSESLGLWMLYALYTEDEKMFQKSFQTLKNEFLLEHHLISWKIHQEQSSTNAFIDDVRIISALMTASERWGIKEYEKTAKAIAKSLEEYCTFQQHFVDFYDEKLNEKSRSITLSYLDLTELEKLNETNIITDQLIQHTKSFLSFFPANTVFYPKAYDRSQQAFIYNNPVNLVDQVYVAFHLAKAGIHSDYLLAFLKSEFSKGKLFGQYDRHTLMPAVSYESPGLYGLTILYSLQIGEREFAKSLYDRMILFRVSDPNNPYYGGYMDRKTMSTHIFDNLLPLLAERVMINEELLQEMP